MIARIGCLASCGALSTVMALHPAHGQSINDRKASARATITGSRNLYDGTFMSTGKAMVCGEIPKERSITGTATFVIEYPLDPQVSDQIQSIAFGSNQLVGVKRSASVFRLSVNVRTAKGGRPPAYVLNTDSGNSRNTGSATLAKGKNGSLTLSVAGSNDMGERIQLTVTCM